MAIAINPATKAQSAVKALRTQTMDYLLQPSNNMKNHQSLTHSETDSPIENADDLHTQSFSSMFSASPRWLEIFRDLRRLAPIQDAVFIHGESGTGKKIAARALHQLSGRKGEFIAVNCGTVDSKTLANQLFGQEVKNSTTNEPASYFEQAEDGTLFLDEIAEMPLPLQKRLLTVLETHTIDRNGGSHKQTVNVRVIAATNRERRASVTKEFFQPELYRRLMDFSLYIPPLRECSADIVPLAQHFLDSLNAQNKTALNFAIDTRKKLLAYSWPGNIGELKNIVKRAYLLAKDQVSIELPSDSLLQKPTFSVPTMQFHVGMTFEEMERDMLLKTLAYFNNDKPKTAQVLGISLKTVYNHLSKLTESKSDHSKNDASGITAKEII